MELAKLSKQDAIILITLVRSEIENLEQKPDPVLREHTRVYEMECRDLLARLVATANGETVKNDHQKA